LGQMMIMILKAPPPTTQIVHWQLEIMVIAALDFFCDRDGVFQQNKIVQVAAGAHHSLALSGIIYSLMPR
jgi:hypothetical protein